MEELQLVKMPRVGQTDMVCQTGSSTIVMKIGDVASFTQGGAEHVLSRFPGCFSKAVKKAEPEEKKMKSDYSNKAMKSSEAK